MVKIEQSVLYVCPDNNIWTSDLWSMYLACWIVLTLSRSRSKFKVIDQISLSQEENVAKVVGATSSKDV